MLFNPCDKLFIRELFKLGSKLWVGVNTSRQAINKSVEVKVRAAYEDRELASCTDLFNKVHRIFRKVSCRVVLSWVADIYKVVGDAARLFSRYFFSTNIKATIVLPTID